jgi:hypothetical protein
LPPLLSPLLSPPPPASALSMLSHSVVSLIWAHTRRWTRSARNYTALQYGCFSFYAATPATQSRQLVAAAGAVSPV